VLAGFRKTHRVGRGRPSLKYVLFRSGGQLDHGSYGMSFLYGPLTGTLRIYGAAEIARAAMSPGLAEAVRPFHRRGGRWLAVAALRVDRGNRVLRYPPSRFHFLVPGRFSRERGIDVKRVPFPSHQKARGLVSAIGGCSSQSARAQRGSKPTPGADGHWPRSSGALGALTAHRRKTSVRFAQDNIKRLLAYSSIAQLGGTCSAPLVAARGANKPGVDPRHSQAGPALLVYLGRVHES